jgi:hypothetical protein
MKNESLSWHSILGGLDRVLILDSLDGVSILDGLDGVSILDGLDGAMSTSGGLITHQY